MTEFSRRGHFRVNADGTRFWVSEHVVDRRHYSLTVAGKEHFVDGNKLLLRDICKHCYQTIYYASLHGNKKVFFNSLNEPLTIHNCTKNIKSNKVQEALKSTKKYLLPHEINALRARGEEVRQRAEKNKRQAEIDEITSLEKGSKKNQPQKKKKKEKKKIVEARRKKLRRIEERQRMRLLGAEKKKNKSKPK